MDTSLVLSQLGREVNFPTQGILQQSAEAKHTRINATIGIALDDEKNPLVLPSLMKQLSTTPSHAITYAPSSGISALRSAWQQHIKDKNPSLLAPMSLPIVCNGLTHALSIASQLFIDETTPIFIPDYFRGNYTLLLQTQNKKNITHYTTFHEQGLDLDAFKNMLDSLVEKSVIFINFPNNPSGYMPTYKEVQLIRALLQEKANHIPLIIICDDAYIGFHYEDTCYPESLWTAISGSHDNILAIKIDGISKEYYARGLRIGFLTFAGNFTPEIFADREQKAAAFMRGSVSNISHLSQDITLRMLGEKHLEQERTNHYQLLRERYDTVKKYAYDDRYQQYFSPLPFNAGYFMSLKIHHHDGEILRNILRDKYDIGVIHIARLHILRIAYSSVPKKEIAEIFAALYEACTQDA